VAVSTEDWGVGSASESEICMRFGFVDESGDCDKVWSTRSEHLDPYPRTKQLAHEPFDEPTKLTHQGNGSMNVTALFIAR